MSDRRKKQVLVGRVVSTSMEKTVVVEVSRRVLHPVYKKYITKKKKYSAHLENKKCALGDTVKIITSRPISKTKRWSVTEVMGKGKRN